MMKYLLLIIFGLQLVQSQARAEETYYYYGVNEDGTKQCYSVSDSNLPSPSVNNSNGVAVDASYCEKNKDKVTYGWGPTSTILGSSWDCKAAKKDEIGTFIDHRATDIFLCYAADPSIKYYWSRSNGGRAYCYASKNGKSIFDGQPTYDGLCEKSDPPILHWGIDLLGNRSCYGITKSKYVLNHGESLSNDECKNAKSDQMLVIYTLEKSRGGNTYCYAKIRIGFFEYLPLNNSSPVEIKYCSNRLAHYEDRIGELEHIKSELKSECASFHIFDTYNYCNAANWYDGLLDKVKQEYEVGVKKESTSDHYVNEWDEASRHRMQKVLSQPVQ